MADQAGETAAGAGRKSTAIGELRDCPVPLSVAHSCLMIYFRLSPAPCTLQHNVRCQHDWPSTVNPHHRAGPFGAFSSPPLPIKLLTLHRRDPPSIPPRSRSCPVAMLAACQCSAPFSGAAASRQQKQRHQVVMRVTARCWEVCLSGGQQEWRRSRRHRLGGSESCALRAC